MSPGKRSKKVDEAEEQRLLIEFCLAKKKNFLSQFLKEKDLYFSGTRDVLRTRLNEYLTDGALVVAELVAFLNRVEGWGNQHIFLYEAPSGLLSTWRDIAQARKILAQQNVAGLLNAPKPLVMPERAELSSIELVENRLRFIWVERKTWYQRSEDYDEYPTEDLILKAYKLNIERRVTTFEINLLEGNAYLAIPNISKSAVDSDVFDAGKSTRDHYEVLRQQFESHLEPFITISSFRRIRLSKAIKALVNSAEVKSREDGFETPSGGKILFTSPDVESDTKSDTSMNPVKAAIPTDVKETLGSYYWQPSPSGLNRILFVKLSAPANSIAFRVQCSEDEVRYVLSRIRKLCK